MSFPTGRKCFLCLDKVVLARICDAIPFVGKDGRLLADKVQQLLRTTLTLLMEVFCRLTTEPSRPVELRIMTSKETQKWLSPSHFAILEGVDKTVYQCD